MVEAYILVQTEVGKAADVASHIGKISGVTQAEDVTGPYDVIVRAQAENVDELGLDGIPGLRRDVDTPADLREAVTLGLGPYSAPLAAGLLRCAPRGR